MPKSDTIEDWKTAIEAGIRYKEKYGKSARWKVYRDYGRGIFPGFIGSTSGVLPYNITHEMKAVTVPNVYFRNPYVTISPRYKPGFHINAKIVESIDNWLIQEMDVKASMKTAVIDCYYTDRGIIKLGYDSYYGGPSPTNMQKLSEILNTPLGLLGKKGEKVEYNVNVKQGMPWTNRILPDRIVVPFGTRVIEDMPWIDHIVIRRLDDVKQDKMYVNTGKLQGTHMEMLNKDAPYADFYKDLTQNVDYVEIHEIRDYKRGEIKAFVSGHDKWIRPPMKDEMQIEGLPYVDFTFNEDTEYYWGPSDVQLMEPQQLEINETKTQAMLHRRIALVKFIVETNLIDDTEIDKMLSEMVGPVVKVKGDPNKVIAMLQPHIPQDLTMWTEQIRSEVRSLLGHSRQHMGEAPAGRRTKYEMQMVQGGREIRMDERRDIVATALAKIVRKTNQVVFSRWSEKQVAQVVGYDGARYWVAYTGRENQAEYNVKVDVESMTPTTKASKKQEIVQIIQALSKNPRANIDYLMKMLLREYEWMDAMQILPEAQETMDGPMGQREFMGQQQKLLDNPAQLQARAGKNAQMVGGIM